MEIIKELNQTHLNLPTEEDHELYKQVKELNQNYPGGLQKYIQNGKVLFNEKKNPYEGWQIEAPKGIHIDFNQIDYIEQMETIGMQQIQHSCAVLVAGGLGERLGFKGIKLRIPIDLLTETTYLGFYLSYLRNYQRRLNCIIPLIIMTSDDTHDLTLEHLQQNNYFELNQNQIHILKQQKVPCFINKDGHLSQLDNKLLETKPHGHGDVHILINQSQLIPNLVSKGYRYAIFFQDTNASIFRSLASIMGVVHTHDLVFSSVGIKKKVGESLGVLCNLKNDQKQLLINVEYSEIEKIIGPEPQENGWSLFSGNTNTLVIRMEEYARVLQQTGGLVEEFCNPKLNKDGSFQSSARLECMMQDFPKLLDNQMKVGFVVMERLWAFSPCKNNLQTSLIKQKQGLYEDSAVSAERDFYKLNKIILEMCGVQFEGEAFVFLHPSVGVTISELKQKFKGKNFIKNNSTLLLYNGFENLYLDGSIKIVNYSINQRIENKQYIKFYNKIRHADVTEKDEQIYQIRGYTLQNLNIQQI